jgi:hypothetical protein
MLRIGFPDGCAKPGFSDNKADAAPAAPSNCLLVILPFSFHKPEGE